MVDCWPHQEVEYGYRIKNRFHSSSNREEDIVNALNWYKSNVDFFIQGVNE